MSAALAAVVSTAALTPEARAQSTAGPYLAGRQAIAQSDYAAASRYYVQALARDTDNAELMEGATLSFLSLGEVSRAAPIAARMEAAGLRSQSAHMVTIAELLIAEDYDGYLARDADTQGIGPLVDTLIAAWATMGQGNTAGAFEQFDAVSKEAGMSGFAMYHKAMAYGLVGDFESAEALYADEGAGAMNRTRRGIIARAEGLSQVGRNEDALQNLRLAFGAATDPELRALITALEAGDAVAFSHVMSARDGVAEVFYSLAGALRGEAAPDSTLLYGRMAHALRPDHVDALLLNAELLEELGQYDLAIAAYKAVPTDHTASHAAELGRAAALRRSDKVDAAIEVLEQLTRRFPDMAVVQSTLGDVLRQKEDYDEAVKAYDRAIDLIPEGGRGRWFTHYARAIAHERLDNWAEAEADFRKALELNPEQPQVLNYLGYSMVEQQVNLDEALDMIERAVAKEPDSGYIVDSLGWVLYRLGRYEEAVGHMERAVELMPVDPVVNDHLGDVYWSVGRAREAEFQWKRALSFVDLTNTESEADPDRMRRKLEVGLDAVLEMEGASPLKVANDN
jgi:tetratricopeptide (TPR) repeat protein